MSADTIQKLRAATGAAHRRLERRLDILARISRPGGRRALVEGFYRLHAGAEAAVAPWLTGLDDLDFEARRRSPRLLADLARLGAAPPAVPVWETSSVGEALGLAYVLEGSSLGGRVIRREVAAAGGDMEGLSFLDPYGARTGECWRAFLAVLERETAAEASARAAVAGAQAGFRLAEGHLCPAGAGA